MNFNGFVRRSQGPRGICTVGSCIIRGLGHKENESEIIAVSLRRECSEHDLQHAQVGKNAGSCNMVGWQVPLEVDAVLPAFLHFSVSV